MHSICWFCIVRKLYVNKSKIYQKDSLDERTKTSNSQTLLKKMFIFLYRQFSLRSLSISSFIAQKPTFHNRAGLASDLIMHPFLPSNIVNNWSPFRFVGPTHCSILSKLIFLPPTLLHHGPWKLNRMPQFNDNGLKLSKAVNPNSISLC